MAKSEYTTSFEVETIEAQKGNALWTTKKGNLQMDVKKANPDYDPKAKKGTSEAYKMSAIRNVFDYFIIRDDEKNGLSVAFKISDHLNLAGGVDYTAFPREFEIKE